MDIKTISINERKSKINISEFAKISSKKDTFTQFINSLPNILAGNDLKKVINAIVNAKRKGKPVIFCMGAHVIKCGLSLIVIELLKKKIISCITITGASLIHDVEIALYGKTSEYVEESLKEGLFGMAREPNDFINKTVKEATAENIGLGEIICKGLVDKTPRFAKFSILFHAYKYNIPVTCHIAIGTDVNHMHKEFDAKKFALYSYNDFLKLVGIIKRLSNGGVIINAGSAVILPEVILKALNLAINSGYKLKNFTTCNIDFIKHYRAVTQIVDRVNSIGGRGYFIVSHHEIILPIIAKAVLERV